ncbi:MAG: DUF1515 family protein [Deltaproteobacteria bacterium]|nr:DUF1515 family protein [Deltaproteobacteria bacterium]
MSDSPTAVPVLSQEDHAAARAQVEAQLRAMTARAEQAEQRERASSAQLAAANDTIRERDGTIRAKDAAIQSQMLKIAELEQSVSRWKLGAGLGVAAHIVRSLLK